MKKIILILAVLLSGCSDAGNEVICSSSGELFYRLANSGGYVSDHAQSLNNHKQFCMNAPDGSITIKNRDSKDLD